MKNFNNIPPLDRIGDYSRQVLKEQLELKTVVAIWDNLKKLPKKAQLDELHISCGVETEENEEQFSGYFPDDTGASLTVEQNGEFWKVVFKAPSRGIETQEGYWLSPSLFNEQIEATSFYIE